MLDLYAPEQIQILRLFRTRRRDHNEHVAILDALRRRDPRQAWRRCARTWPACGASSGDGSVT
jgi:GntR family transcriptional regulator, transcriptional repressor for pyruvate dehydrogenase complex